MKLRVLSALLLALCIVGCGEKPKYAERAVVVSPSANNPAVAAENATPTSAPSAASTSATATQPASKVAGKQGIAWASSFERARELAKAQKKAVFIDFYTDWCSACKMLDEKIFPQPEVVKASQQFVAVKVNAEQRSDIAQQYGVTAYPTLIWIKSDGVPVHRQDGVSADPADLIAQMNQAQVNFQLRR